MTDLSEDILFQAWELGVHNEVLDLAGKTTITAAVTYSRVIEDAFNIVVAQYGKNDYLGEYVESDQTAVQL